MSILSKRRVGGTMVLGAGLWFGRETFAWLLGKGLDLVSQGTGTVTLATFPWQNALATILALVGFYLAFWPSSKPAPVTPKQHAGWLAENARRLAGRINNHRHWSSGAMEMRDPLEKVVRDGISLLISFEKAGYAVPDLSDLASYQKVAAGMQTYFLAIGPLLRDGHLQDAQRAAAKFARDAREEALAIS